jgi:glycine/D-amino acid oxidase-like deaminating enzyme
VSDVVVIGAGAFGAWTAHHLSNAGARVTLVDAYGPGNSRSSSGDESRILRYGYGTDEIYSRLARRSREQWRELDARNGSDLRLWHPCGVLWLAPEGDAYAADTRATLEGGDYPLELLDRATMGARYPHINADDIGSAMLEPEGGVIMARRSIQALASELTQKGVRVIRGRVEKPSASGRLSAVQLADGKTLAGDTFVFACAGVAAVGVSRSSSVSESCPTRQVVVYFGTSAGDDRFSASTHARMD